MKPARVAAIVVKESREIVRDRPTLAVALLMPLVMLFLFGYAVALDVDDVRMGVVDQDRSAASRALVRTFAAGGTFRLALEPAGPDAAERALERGTVRLALIIPAGFEERLARGERAPVQVLVDGTYSDTANLIMHYAEAIITGFGGEGNVLVKVKPRVWYNPALDSTAYVVPGLFGVILMALPPLLTALALTREKQTGSIQQIFASPVTAAEFLAGKLIPYGLLAYLQLVMVVAIGLLWFDVPARGNPGLLLAVGLIYVFCTVGIGLLVSTLTRSQLVAMLLALIVTLMPAFLFSGFLFPIFTMPYVMQLYTQLFPAQFFIDFSRALLLKGSGFNELWPAIVVLAAYTTVIFGFAVWRFRKKVA
ncbi:MAG: ABC transporter permease [Wenzhouxiangellaceae bacterium]